MSALESIITKGGKVAEKDVLNLIEFLMNQLLKLDGIMADGDVKLQRKMQVIFLIFYIFNLNWIVKVFRSLTNPVIVLMKVRRVQKYVETLDMLKIKNSMPSSNKHHSNGQRLAPIQEQPQQQPPRHSNGHVLASIQEQQARHSFENLSIQQQYHHQQQQQQSTRHSTSGPVVVTTKWETFDSSPGLMQVSSSSTSTSTFNPATNNNNNSSGPPKFPWEFFD